MKQAASLILVLCNQNQLKNAFQVLETDNMEVKGFECNKTMSSVKEASMSSNKTIKISNATHNKKSTHNNENVEHVTKERVISIIDAKKKSQNIEDITLRKLNTIIGEFSFLKSIASA